jgi:microcystin degradation protein MlrC
LKVLKTVDTGVTIPFMRVGILGLIHESNTFFEIKTSYEDFRDHQMLWGEAIHREYKEAFHEVGGFFAGLEKENLEAIPLYFAYQQASGTITAAALEKLWQDIEVALEGAGHLDALLIAAHGAAVSESQPDMDGWWLSKVCEKVGSIPIICTLDPHANASQQMIDTVDASIAYRTNPHIDQRERGLEAAHLLARILRGEVKPTQALAMPPVVINIERQLTSASPCLELQQLAEEIRKRPEVLSVSVILGFPYADVTELGSSFIVVTNNDPALARQFADELANYLWNHRHDFISQLIEVDHALERIAKLPHPVCLLDMGDNIGGGSPGDSTVLAHALLQKNIKAFVCLNDPQTVQQVEQAGIGNTITLKMGAKTPSLHGEPLEATVSVLSLHEGLFYETQARHGGATSYNMGRTAIVQANSLTIMLTSKRTAPFSLQQLLSCGVNPKTFDAIVAKGVHAPVAAYAPVCPSLLRVNTTGVTSADLSHFKYVQRRKPLFPFENK